MCNWACTMRKKTTWILLDWLWIPLQKGIRTDVVKQEPFSDEAIHTEHQAILANEQVLTLNIIFSFPSRTNSPKATFISFNLADVCSRAFWETWVSYTRKLNFIYIFITICPYVTRSCVQPEETEGTSILKSKFTYLGYSQDIRPATAVAATTGWFQSKLEWLIQQPKRGRTEASFLNVTNED